MVVVYIPVKQLVGKRLWDNVHELCYYGLVTLLFNSLYLYPGIFMFFFLKHVNVHMVAIDSLYPTPTASEAL